MNTSDQVKILSEICTLDEAGRHFTQNYDSGDLSALEAAGFIEIDRPVHDQTDIMYSQEYWSVTVTEDGADWVELFPEYWAE